MMTEEEKNQLEAQSVLISLAGKSALAMFTKDISHD